MTQAHATEMLQPYAQGSCQDYYAVILRNGKRVWRCCDHHPMPEQAIACAEHHIAMVTEQNGRSR